MDDSALLVAVIRSLGTTWRALLLYPPDSPMTLDAATHAAAAVDEYLQTEPSLRLEVVRGGFVLRGLDGVLCAPGVAELADAFASHGVGEVSFVAPPQPAEMLSLFVSASRMPHELHEQGGMKAALSRANVGAIKIAAVVLQKVEAPPEIPEDEAEAFLARLASDPDRLAVWLRSLLSSDDEGLIEGLEVLAEAAGDVRVFGRTMALAFQELDADDRDRLLEASIDLRRLDPITSEMIGNLSPLELIAAVRGGRYGTNLLGVSYALANLPLAERLDEVLCEAESALRSADAGDADIAFLRSATARRREGGAEPPLAESVPYYAAALAAIALTPEQEAAASAEASGRVRLDAQGALVVLHLLDTADDFRSYSTVLSAVARAVPKLVESGDTALAGYVLDEVTRRSTVADKSWFGLDQQFAAATETMCGRRTMGALIAAYPADPAAVIEAAKRFVELGGDIAGRNLAAAAMESESEAAFDLAEQVLGRRLAELLAPQAPGIAAEHAARLAGLLARDGGPWCLQALAQMAARPEDKVRIETARGVATVGGPAFSSIMPRLLRDTSPTVSSFAARVSARRQTPDVIEMFARRLDELEGDKDVLLGKELIGGLATSPSPVAEAALQRLAEKGGLLHKGRYAELRQHAREALAARATKAGG